MGSASRIAPAADESCYWVWPQGGFPNPAARFECHIGPGALAGGNSLPDPLEEAISGT
jgi:hypothetical protein